MSECLGDARYSKSIYALLSRSIVRSLLCYRVRDNDHCCVLCDVTRDLLFAKYIVHQPNVYQYGALIYPASLRQGLDYLPVNSKTSYPRAYPGHFSVQWGIWPKIWGPTCRALTFVSKCWSAFRSACTSRSSIIDVIAPIFTVLLEHLRAYEATCIRTQHCWSNIVGQQLPILRPFALSLKESVKCGFLKWTVLLEWTNVRETVFLDLRYFGCV